MAQLAAAPNDHQLRAHFDGLVRRGAFNPLLRFVPVDIGEERLQDAIAQTWEAYRHYALDRAKVLPDAILVHHARLRITDPNRHFVKAEGTRRRIHDVMDWRNFAMGRVEVLRWDGALDEDEDASSGEGDRELLGLAAADGGSVARKILSAIDLESWVDGLDEFDRRLLEARAAGFTLEETAADLGVSTSTVFNQTKQLGQDLAGRMGVDLDAYERRCERRGEPVRRRGRPPTRNRTADARL